jgi:hypothetical protein
MIMMIMGVSIAGLRLHLLRQQASTFIKARP